MTKDTITIDRAEYEALRTLARKGLGDSPTETLPQPAKRDRKVYPGDALTMQEQLIVDRLKAAGDRGLPASAAGFNMHGDAIMADAPANSQIARIRTKLGGGVIETVWPTKVNARGRVVRDVRLGATYRWRGL